MAAVTTYSKRKPIQRVCKNEQDIFKVKDPFSSDSSCVDNTRSSHRQKDQKHTHSNESTSTNESDGSDINVVLPISKSLMSKRKKNPDETMKTSKFAEPVLFQDPATTTPDCKHPKTRHIKAGIKQDFRDVNNTLKLVVANRKHKVTMPQPLPFGRLATRRPIKSPRLQPPRYVNTYEAPESVDSPDSAALEGESSQETGPPSQPTSQSQSGDEDVTCDSTEYTFSYIWTTATGSTDVLVTQYPSIELPRRQCTIQEDIGFPSSPQYIERDTKENDFNQTDVSYLSQMNEDCEKGLIATIGEDYDLILNSTLRDDGWAKNIQDVSIMISPIHEPCESPKRIRKSDIKDIYAATHLNCSTQEKGTIFSSESLMEMKQCSETTPQKKKLIQSPKTPLKIKSGKPKMGKLQPKSSTFIFAEDDYKHLSEYVTVEISEIPEVNDQHKTSEMGYSPELKVTEQEFLTSTPVRGSRAMNKQPKDAFSIDLSTVQIQSADSDELQINTSKIVNSTEIHVSSPKDFITAPDTCVKITHSPNISIPDVEEDCMACDKVCILETSVHSGSVNTNDNAKEVLKKMPGVYHPSAYQLCVIVALSEDTSAPQENRILQWHNPSKCPYRTLIKNTPIDILEALDI